MTVFALFNYISWFLVENCIFISCSEKKIGLNLFNYLCRKGYFLVGVFIIICLIYVAIKFKELFNFIWICWHDEWSNSLIDMLPVVSSQWTDMWHVATNHSITVAAAYYYKYIH